MPTALDYLVILFLVLSTLSLLAIAVMFLVKQPLIKRICLLLLAVTGLYLSAMGIYIGRFVFLGQTLASIVLGIAAIVAVALEFWGKSEKTSRIARILVTASAVLGVVAAFC